MGCACDNYNRHKNELNKYHHHHINCDCDDSSCGCSHNHSNSKKESIILLSRIAISLIFLVSAIFLNNVIQIVFLIVSYLIISYDIIISAFKNIIKGKVFDENFLMMLASLTALIVFIINPNAGIDGFDGVLVALLYQFGEFIQHKAVDKSKQSINEMLTLDVDKVTLVIEGKERIINPNKLKVNDIIKILPGEKIPTDGIIISGSSSINSSSLTGESKPIDVFENDKVVSGCINMDGVLYVKALTTIDDSTSSKISKMIKEASKNKAKGERFISKFAKYYTPIVIIIALIVAFIIPIFLGFKDNFINYLYKGLTIMVISCPCALVISIPLSYFVGIGKSAKHSILIKGSSYIEDLSKVKAIAFDKTGTITKGNFKVLNIVSNEIELINKLLYSIEKNFTHPIAKSICDHLKDVKEVNVIDLKNKPGYGVIATYENKQVLLGNEKLLNEFKINFDKVDSNNTLVYVSYDNKYLGYVEIVDEIKEDSIETINILKEQYQLYLISGDNKQIVSEVANKVNISNYYYQKLPEEKVEVINKIKETNSVAYVGDGINDAACLLNANVGISMRSLGSDIAITASDIVIMDDKVSNVKKAIDISKKTTKTIVFNIVISITIKVLVMILAMIIKLPIWVAIIADVGVCLLTILNSLTIMYGKYIK